MDEFSALLNDYDFDLPPGQIAQSPPEGRGGSRLLTLNRLTGEACADDFKNLLNHLPPKSLLVFNNAKVTPARIYGQKISGGKMEALLLELPPLEAQAGIYDLWCLAKPGRRLKIGDELSFSDASDRESLKATIIEKSEDGRSRLSFNFFAPPHDVLAEIGHMPLPPYLKRPDTPEDKKRYQTVYAQKPGAIAAPTAGLHFTDDMLKALKEQGHDLAWVTLWVGMGTFAPLTPEHLQTGRLHQEQVEMPAVTAQALKEAKALKCPIISVGTTTARVIEWSVIKGQGQPESFSGSCDLFIKPGHNFYLDALITNFHLPRSSLLMLVAALAGRENLMRAYQKAIKEDFRFYSYGDAMLIV